MANEPTIEQMDEVIAVFDGWKKINGDPALVCPSCDEGKVPSGWCICDQKNDRFQKEGKMVSRTYFQYHTSWDWLVPVVEKIESIYDDFHGYFGVHISSNGCTIQGTKFNTTPDHEHYAYFNDVTHETKILATHYAVYQFIIWFKQKKQKDGNPVA